MASRCKSGGVYKIVHVPTGRAYIGSTNSFGVRFYDHRRLLAKGKHFNSRLQRAWDKHGSGSFEFVIVLEMTNATAVERLLVERNLISVASSVFNTVTNPTLPLFLGRHHTKEARRRISAGNKLKKLSVQHRQRLVEVNLGRRLSDDHRLKISRSCLGRRIAPEIRERLRETSLAYWRRRKAEAV